jgi:L-aspartate oxidase
MNTVKANPQSNQGSDQCDLVVVGAGVAGLYTALVASQKGLKVTVVSRKKLVEISSFWAQGGLAAVIDPLDDIYSHYQDTLKAGRNLCDSARVWQLVNEAPKVLQDLIDQGMHFDSDQEGQILLGLEGGHSKRRICHAGGASTGSHLLWWLSSLVSEHPLIKLDQASSVQSLLLSDDGCHGVRTQHIDIHARHTMLATGGAAGLWNRSSNPPGAIGAGMLLAWQAQAALVDMEFCQFHPTALYLPGHPKDGFLLTEALRGDGALLRNQKGQRFINELAPRDEVSMAVYEQISLSDNKYIYLDLRPVDQSAFRSLIQVLTDLEFDPKTELIPIAPAAHYMMGGIQIDEFARSTLPGLYALGECACSGVHGANRLASNSLSECFVWAKRAADFISKNPGITVNPNICRASEQFIPPTIKSRQDLDQYAGMYRTEQSLEMLLNDPYPLSQVIARSALMREESRGSHQRVDYLDTKDTLDKMHFINHTNPTSQHWEKW